MSMSWAKLGKGSRAGDYHISQMEADESRRVKNWAGQDGYYTDSSEPPGEWWSLSGSIVTDKSPVLASVYRCILGGYHPETGLRLCQRPGDAHLAGYDLSLSAPKSVSALWACANSAMKSDIEKAQTTAVRSAYEFMARHGLFVTRMGNDGVVRAQSSDVMIGRFRHHTSRAGDPQLHDHGVIANIGRGPDGKTRTLETDEIMRWQGAIAAAYRVALAQELRSLGFSIRRDGRNFEVNGVPAEVISLWSKRRNEIEETAKERGFVTATSRKRAQIAALDTRSKKNLDLTPEALAPIWHNELCNVGASEKEIIASAIEAGAEKNVGLSPDILVSVIDEATAKESVFGEAHLVQLVMEHCQGVFGINEAEKIIAKLVSTQKICQVGLGIDGRPCYSTEEMISLERQMLLDAILRRDEPSAISMAVMDEVIREYPDIDPEQTTLANHLARSGGVSVAEGSAGTGKTYMTNIVVDAARRSGKKVKGFAPSWKAASVLKADSGLQDTAALQGYVQRLDRGMEVLNRDEVVIVDEAGMVSVRDMALLLKHGRQSGASVILLGDTRQLEAIGPGGPMAAIAREIGSERMVTVRRQRDSFDNSGQVTVSRQWMRVASELLAEGKGDVGLTAYDSQDRIKWAQSREEALQSLVDDYGRHLSEKRSESRLVITSRNVDVRILNERLREICKARNIVTGPEVAFSALDRKGVERTLAIAAGDRIVFGEKIDAHGINNSDIATVKRVEFSEDGNHKFVVELDKERGVLKTISPSSLIGWRDKNNKSRIPKLQHAYAGTNYLAQGQTSDMVFVYNPDGMDMRSLYVSMTRHRYDVRLYIDTDRVKDIIANRSDNNLEPSLEEIKNYVKAEVLKYRSKKNVSDFVKNRSEWIKTGKIIFTEPSPMLVPAAPALSVERDRMKVRQAQSSKQRTQRLPILETALAKKVTVRTPMPPKKVSAVKPTRRPKPPAPPPTISTAAKEAAAAVRAKLAPDVRLGRSQWNALKSGVSPILENAGLSPRLSVEAPTECRVTADGRPVFSRRDSGEIVGLEVVNGTGGVQAIGGGLAVAGGQLTSAPKVYVCTNALEAQACAQALGCVAVSVGDASPETLLLLAGATRAATEVVIALRRDAEGIQLIDSVLAALATVRQPKDEGPDSTTEGVMKNAQAISFEYGPWGDSPEVEISTYAAAQLAAAWPTPIPAGVRIEWPPRGRSWGETILNEGIPLTVIEGIIKKRRDENYRLSLAADIEEGLRQPYPYPERYQDHDYIPGAESDDDYDYMDSVPATTSPECMLVQPVADLGIEGPPSTDSTRLDFSQRENELLAKITPQNQELGGGAVTASEEPEVGAETQTGMQQQEAGDKAPAPTSPVAWSEKHKDNMVEEPCIVSEAAPEDEYDILDFLAEFGRESEDAPDPVEVLQQEEVIGETASATNSVPSGKAAPIMLNQSSQMRITPAASPMEEVIFTTAIGPTDIAPDEVEPQLDIQGQGGAKEVRVRDREDVAAIQREILQLFDMLKPDPNEPEYDPVAIAHQRDEERRLERAVEGKRLSRLEELIRNHPGAITSARGHYLEILGKVRPDLMIAQKEKEAALAQLEQIVARTIEPMAVEQSRAGEDAAAAPISDLKQEGGSIALTPTQPPASAASTTQEPDKSGFTFETANGSITIELTPEQVASERVLRYALVTAAENGIELNGVDFSGLDLSMLDLSNLKVRGANFSGANLFGCVFKGADFRQTVLDGANLDRADFTGANLRGAVLARPVTSLAPDAALPKRADQLTQDIEFEAVQYARGTGAARVLAAARLADLMIEAESRLGERHGKTIKIEDIDSDIRKLELAHVIQRAIPWDLIDRYPGKQYHPDLINFSDIDIRLKKAVDPILHNVTREDAMSQPEPARSALSAWLDLEDRRKNFESKIWSKNMNEAPDRLELRKEANWHAIVNKWSADAYPEELQELYTLAHEFLELWSEVGEKATLESRLRGEILDARNAAGWVRAQAIASAELIPGLTQTLTGDMKSEVLARQKKSNPMATGAPPRLVQPCERGGGDDDEFEM